MSLTGFDHRVRWDEFTSRSSRPTGIDEDAQIKTRTVSGGFQSHQPRGEECRIISASIGLSVDPGLTWVVEGHQSDDLLNHEQGHYDITALGTRELYNRVLQITAPRCPDINGLVLQLQTQIQIQIDAADDRYDLRTDHGINATIQQNWDTQIRAAKQNPNGTLANLPQ